MTKRQNRLALILGALVVLGVGFALFEWVRRRFMRQWSDIQVAIEKHTQHREAA